MQLLKAQEEPYQKNKMGSTTFEGKEGAYQNILFCKDSLQDLEHLDLEKRND